MVSRAFSTLSTGSVVPGTIGTPAFSMSRRAAVFEPMASIAEREPARLATELFELAAQRLVDALSARRGAVEAAEDAGPALVGLVRPGLLAAARRGHHARAHRVVRRLVDEDERAGRAVLAVG